MKIIKIEIENINSIKGKWEIDLEHESYAQHDNQFVICGETGSGKTTILDAITLALYGKTPREDKVSKSENEILCKGTARCMAAVTYDNNGMRYRSEFSQSRAHNSVTGNLQSPSISVKNLTTGDDYEVSSVKNLEILTVDLIGLNYDQFCKSVLLAQGSFSSFLKGDEREKAEILAKLNGTEDFKKASNLLWEKTKSESEACEREINEIDAIEILPDEKVESYKDELAEKNRAIERLGEEETSLNKKLVWREQLKGKGEELKTAQDDKNSIDIKIEQFKEERIVLERAEKALNCEGQYSSYVTYFDKDAELVNAIAEARKGLETAEMNKSDASIAQTKAKEAYEKIYAQKTDNANLWNRVISIDSKIKGLEEKYEEQKSRAEKAKKAYDDNSTEASSLEKLITEADKRIAQLEEYITEHKNDEKLEKVVLGLDGKKQLLSDDIAKVSELEGKVETTEATLKTTSEQCDAIAKEIEEMESELKEFVSSNFKSISMVLRHNCLEDKCACPVCGSVDHPFIKDADAEVVHSNDNSIAAMASELSSKIEEKQAEKTALERNLDLINIDLSGIKGNLDAVNSDIEKIILDVNDRISAWNIKVESKPITGIIKRIDEIVIQLTDLSNNFNSANKEKDEKISNRSLNKTKLDGINLKKLEEEMNDEAAKATENYRSYSDALAERKQLFGDKCVEDEQARYNNELNDANKDYETAVKKYNDSEIAVEKAGTKLEGLEDDCKKNTALLKSATEELENVIALNGFVSIDELKSSRRETSVIDALKAKRTELENNKVAYKTKLDDVKGAYDELLRQNLTEDSIEVISGKISQLKSNRDQINKEIGEINKILADNDEMIQKKAGLLERRQELKDRMKIYEDLRLIIGVKDGSDIEVFVQKMALSNLLISANGYLEQILPCYSLVQKPKSLDCMLHDENHPQDDRPISNLSGGETFAISLSLALGIAEIASHRIQIESLFLDEGFGTLSGDPLDEAIDALKRLRTTGKTLGIITHVQKVIESFDQRITARKCNGVSTLEGDGITRV